MTRLNDPTRTHPHDRDLYTPITAELIAYLNRAHLEAGTWRNICEAGGIKLRQLRRVRTAGTTTISMRLMDRIIVGSGVGSLDDWFWFTPEDLIRMGLWKEPLYVAGRKRYHRGKVWEHVPLSPYQRELAMRRKAARRRRLKVLKLRQANRIDHKRLERDRFLEGFFR